MQDQIDALESLSTIDTELRELRTQVEGERGTLTSKKDNLQDLEERLGRSRSSLEEMERLRNELHTEVRQMSGQIEKSREKLSRSRNEREANAAQREVEELRKLYRDRELEIEKLSGLCEQARSELDVLTSKRQAILDELGANEGAITVRLGELEARMAELESTRAVVAKRLPPALFRRYDQVMKRKGAGVAHTTHGTCSACHMQMPPQQFQQLLRGTEFQACNHCNRIIYFRPPSASNADDGDSAGSP
jgi:predicted  nucleic acid-binding Zn-ribbon protein